MGVFVIGTLMDDRVLLKFVAELGQYRFQVLEILSRVDDFD